MRRSNPSARSWWGIASALLLAAPCLVAPCLAAASARLAVFELRNEAGSGDAEVAYLTDRLRAEARKGLPPGMVILTRESLLDLIPANVRLEDCDGTACEIAVGRKIGVDYIVSGELLKFGGELRLNLKAHAVATGAFLAGEVVAGAKLGALEAGLPAATGRLYAAVRADAEPVGVSVPEGVAPAVQAWAPRTPAMDPAPAKRARPTTAASDSAALAALGLVERDGLVWTMRDNGEAIDWQQARRLAATARVGGRTGWRLPTVAELATLYDESRATHATQRAYEVYIAAPFELSTACIWSAESADATMAYLFYYDDGQRFRLNRTSRDCGRVLLVRDAGK